ncbi:DUF4244 domain-containing protein [Paenarthrobacter sp. NPDC090520]|uniref:DUF4244 domain-containing protein n=1 Tax=Paenarthrobacter sp. NPDC090520 TaxID=3364382 RepID=UPI0037F334D4
MNSPTTALTEHRVQQDNSQSLSERPVTGGPALEPMGAGPDLAPGGFHEDTPRPVSAQVMASPDALPGVTSPSRGTSTARITTDRQGKLRLRNHLTGGEAGMATAEYAIATLAAVGLAGLLVVLLRSDEVRGFLLNLIRTALSLP